MNTEWLLARAMACLTALLLRITPGTIGDIPGQEIARELIPISGEMSWLPGLDSNQRLGGYKSPSVSRGLGLSHHPTDVVR